LFHGKAYQERLHHQRLAALTAMEQLHEFRPRLTGAVLSGTATEHAPITLHVFCATVDDLALWAQARRIPMRLGERRVRVGIGEYIELPCYEFAADGQQFELLVFTEKFQRLTPRCPVDGGALRRIGTRELSNLLAASPSSAEARAELPAA
jgi:hypothetical protein